MAGGAAVTNGKGGRKPLDAAINLVPFIDLLSCCISFLLITAVWVNLSQLPARHGAAQPGGEASPPTVQLTLVVTSQEYVLVRSTGESTHLAATDGEPDYRGLVAAMRQVRQEFPGKDDLTVRSSDDVVYDRLIRTLDLLRGEQFVNVNVTAASQGG